MEHDFEDLVTHTCAGTQAILDAARRSSTVERIVVISHADACGMLTPKEDQMAEAEEGGFVFNESCLSDELKMLSGDMPNPNYAFHVAGKMKSEMMAMDWAKREGEGISVVTLCMGNMLGRLVTFDDKFDSFIVEEVMPLITGDLDEIPNGYVSLVHLQDAVDAAVFAMKNDLSGRFLVLSMTVEWRQVAEVMRKMLPLSGLEQLQEGQEPPGDSLILSSDSIPTTVSQTGGRPKKLKFSCSKLRQCGFEFKRNLEDMVRDFSESIAFAGGAAEAAESRKGLPEEGMMAASLFPQAEEAPVA
jgi:nucleoside-diphosphate-sugar epimerase